MLETHTLRRPKNDVGEEPQAKERQRRPELLEKEWKQLFVIAILRHTLKSIQKPIRRLRVRTEQKLILKHFTATALKSNKPTKAQKE